MSTVACSSCYTTLEFPPSAAGKQVRCPKCQHIFMIPAPAAEQIYDVQSTPPSAPRPIVPPPAPISLPRNDDPWDDEDRDARRRDDDDFSPRRRRRDDDDDVGAGVSRRVRGHEHAKAALSGPAIGMIISGILGLICPIFCLVRLFDNPGNNREPVLAVFSILWIAMHYVWAICVLVGASAMRSATNKGLIVFGCIVSFLPCNILWLIAMPMGIWALVAVNQPGVSENIL